MPIRTSRSTLTLALTLLVSCDNAEPTQLLLTPPEEPEAAVAGKCPGETPLDAELPIWDLYLSTQAWDALHLDVAADVEVDALLCVEGRAHPLQLELQGASSRKHKKKSFDLKFADDAPLGAEAFGDDEVLPRVLLKGMALDQTLVREALGFAAWRGMGHVAPRTTFVNLRINGHYWGLYNLIEPIDHDFLARYGFPPGGNLYKAVRTKQGRADFKPGRDLRTGFEDKSDQATDAWLDLKALAGKLQRTSLQYGAFLRDIDRVFPLTPYLDRMVWIAVTQNSDAVAQNFYLYNVPVDGHDAWTMLPWDSNVAFSGHWSDPNEVLGADISPMVDGGSWFGERLLMVPELRAQYIARFRTLLDAELRSELLLEHLRELEAKVAHDLALDQARWQRRFTPEEAFDVVEQYLRDRPAVMLDALDALEAAQEEDAGAGQDADAGKDAGPESHETGSQSDA
ncbi:MAG TPA: CotH kinase family protein [Polyangiales bacterium]